MLPEFLSFLKIMTEAILSVSDRGRQTRDEFVRELEEAEKDWDKNGGLTLSQIKNKHYFL